MWAGIAASPGKKAHFMDGYCWHLIPFYNKVAMEAFSRHDVPVIKFDIESASRLRPDSHALTDCLHLRMPGLMDHWTLWLLNALDAMIH